MSGDRQTITVQKTIPYRNYKPKRVSLAARLRLTASGYFIQKKDYINLTNCQPLAATESQPEIPEMLTCYHKKNPLGNRYKPKGSQKNSRKTNLHTKYYLAATQPLQFAHVSEPMYLTNRKTNILTNK
ncbi:hypothetical protein DPMN_142883 [Dreissena polymorpha]|uniref:Uncharacterized protein n=1 Tax=Dreissena polymorpha TaxID=45954 RepID=A0A9D4JNV0_DREPO|nr:hypothetical protein DPMN_142883 [Dreissena polymorpha]